MEEKIDEQKLKNVQLEMLDDFISVCHKLQLRYFLVGGTCLGAVRHKGFIPWDDDIDVAMPREDYEKFLLLAQEELTAKNLFVQTYKTDPEYIQDFAKLRKNGTTFLETTARNLKIHHGVYMDIFPIDGYPEKRSAQKSLERKKVRAKSYLNRHYFLGIKTSWVRKIKRFILWSLLGFKSDRKILEGLERTYKKVPYETASTVACFGGAWGNLEYCPKAHYGAGAIGIFEGREVVIPELYDEYLTHKYGDYMQLPPPEKQIGHHYCDIIDLENSYEIYDEVKK